jgi:hypothetical protein
LHLLSQMTDMKMRLDTPKSHTQQRKFKTNPIPMSGVLDT